MKTLMAVFIILSLISGSLLIYAGLKNSGTKYILLFFLMGIASIVAAVKYTVGKNPYGYTGFGDLFVFVFFGLVGVCGTYYLHANHWHPALLLPATSIGLLSTGVLNLNNMRDIHNDEESGKRTLVVRMGSVKAKIYHTFLICLSVILSLIYILREWKSSYQLVFLVTLIPLSFHLYEVFANHIPEKLNNQLKVLALTTLFFSITFSLGIYLSV